MSISREVVRTDVRLEKAAESSRMELAQHRWHWTLDESNLKRVSVREYAKDIGRSHITVNDMVNGYAAWSVSGAANTEFQDYMERAKIRGDSLAATEAVAEAKGISIGSARRHHAEEIREVKASAQERVERGKATSVEEEVKVVAVGRQKVRQADAKVREEKKAAHSIRYLQAEGKISVAMRNLRSVLDGSQGVEFTAEERELLADSLAKMRALLNLLDMRIVGAADIDWDAEMAKLGDGS